MDSQLPNYSRVYHIKPTPGIILVKERNHTKFGTKFLNWSHQNSGVDPGPRNKKLSGHRCWVIGALKNTVAVGRL